MKNASDMGFVKVAALSPTVTVANPEKNAETALAAIKKAAAEGVQVMVLPELHLSGYTCGDLFQQDRLIARCEEALNKIRKETASIQALIAVGLPMRLCDSLYNCAAVLQSGKILGVVPKQYLPNYQEFYEKRWFAPGNRLLSRQVTLCGETVFFGSQLFRLGNAVIGVEICEDLWVPLPPSSHLVLTGANLILNLSASNELVAKNAYRRELIAGQSGRCICGYVYASAGVGESTTDLVFSGACTVAENGSILAESERFSRTGSRAVACIDVAKLSAERRKNGSFHDNAVDFSEGIPTVTGVLPHLELCHMDRSYDPTPFIPGDQRTREERCKEIFAIQAAGLAKRLSHTGLKRAVIGISGGLDSTLALLVASETMKLLQYPSENILCITMPGFGTTDRTYQNALELIASLGAELREIDIRPASQADADEPEAPAELPAEPEEA